MPSQSKRKIVATAMGMAAVIAFGMPSAVAQSSEVDEISEQESATIREYMDSGYVDWAVLDDLVQTAGGEPLSLNVNGVDHPVSGAEAERILEERDRAHEFSKAESDGTVQPFAIPLDAFDVVGGFVQIDDLTYASRGQWNFRDDYIGAEAPDNVASVHLDGQGCASLGNITHNSYRYTGEATNQTYLMDAGLSTGVALVGVRDTTSSFGQNADHGYVEAKINGYCGPVDFWRTQFIYEHNQGGSVNSVSASFGVLSIAYSGSPMVMQKSSPVSYLYF